MKNTEAQVFASVDQANRCTITPVFSKTTGQNARGMREVRRGSGVTECDFVQNKNQADGFSLSDVADTVEK